MAQEPLTIYFDVVGEDQYQLSYRDSYVGDPVVIGNEKVYTWERFYEIFSEIGYPTYGGNSYPTGKTPFSPLSIFGSWIAGIGALLSGWGTIPTAIAMAGGFGLGEYLEPDPIVPENVQVVDQMGLALQAFSPEMKKRVSFQSTMGLPFLFRRAEKRLQGLEAAGMEPRRELKLGGK